MFLTPVDIHGYILFNFVVIIKMETNDSHLWSCVCCYQFLALCNKQSLQSNHICKFVKFAVCAICCNLDSQITPSGLKTFKLQQTEMACIMVSKTKLILNHHELWQLQNKASQVITQLSPSMSHQNNMIAKTITDFAFALIETIPIIITITCRSSNKKQCSSSRAKIVFTVWIFLKQLKYKKGNFLCWKEGSMVNWRTSEAKISDGGLSHQIRSGITVD